MKDDWQNSRWVMDVEIVCREYSNYVSRASSLYNSKMFIDH